MRKQKQTKVVTQNETRENEMLSNKTVTTAGAASAAIIGLAFAASLLIPSAALADDECGAQVGTTPVDCSASSYGSGVTYDAVGDLFIDFTNATRSTIGGAGVTLTGDGSESITFDSQSTNTELQSSGVDGALLGVTTVNGDITIDTEEMDADASAALVTHAIFARSTGSGDIDISTAGNVDANSDANPANSIGIEAVTGTGDIAVTVASGSVRGNRYAIRTETGNSAQATVNNSGNINNFSGTAIRATGGTLILNNNSTINGTVDFSGLSGGYTFNNDGTWRVGDINADPGTISDLGAGDLNNTGTIEIRRRTVVSAPGTNFTGTGDSVLEITAVLANGASSLDCATPSNIAGCVDLTGGSTSGQTGIRISASAGGDPFHNPIDAPVNAGVVLVDVGGGTTEADDFVLDPDSGTFSQVLYAEDPIYDSVLVTGGPFDYTLLYNPNTQQHLLASVPQHEALEYAAFIHESLSIWHTTTETVTARNAELRDRAESGRGWLRVVTEQTERDASPVFTNHGNTFVYDQEYSLDTHALIGGYDLMATETSAIGLHVGLVTGSVDFDGSDTRDRVRGTTFGAYGGWEFGALTLDGAVNANVLEIERRYRELEDSSSNVKSLGVRVEAGWLQPLMDEALYVQPLITASYVRTDIEALELRDNQLRFKEEQSARGALGVRVGGETALAGERFSKLGYWLTARAWDEQEGDGNVQFATDADPLAIEDDLSGSFEEVSLGAELTNPKGDFSVYLSGGAKFVDDEDNLNVSIGARLNW